MCLSSLKLSQLGVVHLIALEHEFLISVWHIRALDDKVDVRLLRQLQVVEMINILPLEVDSNYSLLSA